jgi:NitT/TauT family transport system permease protein
MEVARRGSPNELGASGVKTDESWVDPGWWMSAAIVVVALSAWEWGARAGEISALYFPAPSVIARTLVRLSANGTLVVHLKVTLARLLAGSVLGGSAGLVLGLLMGWSHRLRAVLDPLVAATHPIPKIAILPLVLILFGLGETSKVVVIAVAAFFPMLISAMAGVKQISPIHFEVAKNYGAGWWKVCTRVVVPGSLPMVLTGARLTLNIALVLTIAVELLTAQEGLGAMLWLARETLRTEELYAGLVVIAGLGVGFNALLQWASTRLTPWQQRHEV